MQFRHPFRTPLPQQQHPSQGHRHRLQTQGKGQLSLARACENVLHPWSRWDCRQALSCSATCSATCCPASGSVSWDRLGEPVAEDQHRMSPGQRGANTSSYHKMKKTLKRRLKAVEQERQAPEYSVTKVLSSLLSPKV